MPDNATDLLEPPADEIAATQADEVATDHPDTVIAADLLVEEISIDGMCGVY